MKLKIERDRLLRPLGHVSGVVEKRQTLPILGNVYIKQEQNALTLIGTDLETEVLVRVENVDGVEGECTITARKFYDICRMLPDDASIGIVNEGDRTIITSGRSRFSLQSLPRFCRWRRCFYRSRGLFGELRGRVSGPIKSNGQSGRQGVTGVKHPARLP